MNIIFWKWWSTIIIFFFSLYYVQYKLSIIEFIILNDPTYITFAVFAVFILTTLAIGYYSYKLQFQNKHPSESRLSPLWFSADAVMSLGMVGTLLGFLMVLTSAFQNVDTSSAEAMKEVIGQLAKGMGTALLTSLAGLIASIILKFQLVMLESANDNKKV